MFITSYFDEKKLKVMAKKTIPLQIEKVAPFAPFEQTSPL